MEIITASRLRAFRRCKRLHRNRYELGRRRIAPTALPLAFGTLFHRGLEAWWTAMMDAQRWVRDGGEGEIGSLGILDVALGAMAVDGADDEQAELNEYEQARARELMRGYHARWFLETLELEIIGIEVEFLGPLINPATGRASKGFRLGGKIDALVRRNGRVWLVEHKTSAADIAPGATYWLRLRLDGQVSTYFEGGRILGHDVGGCIYDVAKKPAIRPKLATPEDARKYTKDGRLYATQREEDETPDEFGERVREAIMEDPGAWYARGDVVRLDESLAEHGADRWADVLSLRSAQTAGAWPTNPDACEDRASRLCEYWGACTGAESIDDDSLYQIGKKHSELSLTDEVA